MIWYLETTEFKPVADFGFAGGPTANASLFDTAKWYAEQYVARHKLRAVVEFGSLLGSGIQYPTYSVVSTDPMMQGVFCWFVITDGNKPPLIPTPILSHGPCVRPDLNKFPPD